jgi:hypothetical protein
MAGSHLHLSAGETQPGQEDRFLQISNRLQISRIQLLQNFIISKAQQSGMVGEIKLNNENIALVGPASRQERPVAPGTSVFRNADSPSWDTALR